MSIPPSNVTFVTSFIDIYDKPYLNKTFHCRFEKFLELAETGIQICVYIDVHYLDILLEFVEYFPNIKVMKIITVEDTWINKICEQYDDLKMPEYTNTEKDTKEYMILMNAKIEYMYDTIVKNPFGSTHFAWMDFNLSHIWTNTKKTQEKLRIMSQRTLADNFITFGGCWPPLKTDANMEVIDPFLISINWRFCGGFFVGDKDSVIQLYDLYKLYFPFFIFKYRTLIWEVNFWAWLEAITPYESIKWSPTWFFADHNDTIINIPAEMYSLCLNKYANIRMKYNYPNIWDFKCPDDYIVPSHTFSNVDLSNYDYKGHHFAPTSAAYLFFKGKHYLNTRYVNYTLTPDGNYIFSHPNGCNVSHNIFSELNENLCPINYCLIKNPLLPYTEHPLFHGLEDMRLYSLNGKVRFIATTINFSLINKARMIIGDYDIENTQLTNAKIIKSPNKNNWFEKNWIPLVKKKDAGIEEEWFIYQWSPMQIGRVDTNNILAIEKTYNIVSPIFDNLRGSSIFTEFQGNLVGVVHFSENNSPRHYYHALVMLDKDTFKPLKYTQNFYFNKIGIEFCIGFTVLNGSFCFWISQFDRDPMFISIETEKLPFCYSVVYE